MDAVLLQATAPRPSRTGSGMTSLQAPLVNVQVAGSDATVSAEVEHAHTASGGNDTGNSTVTGTEAAMGTRTHGEEEVGAAGATQASWTASVILFIALSFHSMMAGLGIGVSSTSGQVWGLTAAVIAHKTVASFALGSTVLRVQGTTLKLYAAMMTGFSCVTPIGGLIGMAIARAEAGSGDDDGGTDTPVTDALLAIAGGTFVYVGLVEIIGKELPGGDKLLKLLLILSGWGFMAMLALWV